jgi:hypothetical protein
MIAVRINLRKSMHKSSTLFLSTALTAFALVLALGVAWELNRPAAQTSAAVAGAAAGVQQPLPAPAASQPDVSATANSITPQDALRIAMRAFPNSTLRRGPELVDYQGTTAYAMQLSRGVVVVDAKSGDVLFASGLGRSGDDRQPGNRIEGRSAQNDNPEFGDDSD